MTPAAAAREMGLSRQAVHDRILSGEIVPELIGGREFVCASDLVRWRKDRRARAKALLK